MSETIRRTEISVRVETDENTYKDEFDNIREAEEFIDEIAYGSSSNSEESED